MSTQKNDPRALALGVSCYVIWGFFPLYFSLLSPAREGVDARGDILLHQ